MYPAGFTFTTFADKSCKVGKQEFSAPRAGYGFYEAYQMQSYHLSHDLQNFEKLDFFTGYGVAPQRYAINHAVDSHYTESCLQYDSTAGDNATTDDDKDHGGRKAGCHTLNNNEWCANLYIP